MARLPKSPGTIKNYFRLIRVSLSTEMMIDEILSVMAWTFAG